jgi:dethiobiotin synthetase
MRTVVVTGTGTGVGKTVVTAAIAALARAGGRDVAVIKPAQTGVMPGEPGDLDEVRRLAGPVEGHELARFPAALSPEAAARRTGTPPADLREAAAFAAKLAEGDRLVLIEGAGGLAVRYDEAGTTIADLAAILGAPVLVVTAAGLGTLNHTALTLEALAARGLDCAGVVIGSWPRHPDLAMRCNVTDLRVLSGEPLAGAVGEGAGTLDGAAFLSMARAGLSPGLGGTFDAARFERQHDWHTTGRRRNDERHP